MLTTAVVVKGADSFTSLAPDWVLFGNHLAPADAIISLMVVGGIAIALGVFWAYSAAYGDPMANDALAVFAKLQQVDGAWKEWSSAVSKSVTSARSSLKRATAATLAGVLVLAIAVLLTWTAPTRAGSDMVTCFTSGGKIVKLDGGAPDVETGSLTLVPCK